MTLLATSIGRQSTQDASVHNARRRRGRQQLSGPAQLPEQPQQRFGGGGVRQRARLLHLFNGLPAGDYTRPLFSST